MFGVCVVSLPHPSSRDLLMLNVCLLSRCLSPVVETRDVKCLYVCVVLLSQPSSRDLLYVKCLCVLSRCLSPVVEICYMLNVLCVLSRYLSPVVEICYMLNVCVCCLVVSAQ